MDEIGSLKRQYAKFKVNLLKIEEQEADFIDLRAVPPDLEEAKSSLLQRIKKIEQRLAELGYQGDALADTLCNIPFIVAAMTKSEATALMNETVFQNNPHLAPAKLTQFQDFKTSLLEYYRLDDLLSSYKKLRESWTPLVHRDHSISKIISDVLDHINQDHHELPYLRADFVWSQQFFSSDQKTCHQVLKELRRSGGILIIDAISMFHPTLNRQILRDLGAYDKVAILVLSPIKARTLAVNRVIEDTIRQNMPTTELRFESFDHLCQIVGTGDSRIFKRRLFACLPKIIDNIQKHRPRPKLAKLQLLQQIGKQEAHGLNLAFLGSGASP